MGLNAFVLLAFQIQKLGFSHTKYGKKVHKIKLKIKFLIYIIDGSTKYLEYNWMSCYTLFFSSFY